MSVCHVMTLFSTGWSIKNMALYFCPYLCQLLTDFHISQGSVKTLLQCGGMYNNHVITNCIQSVQVKEFWKSVNNWQRYGQK